eukprot:10733356-Ditylum_brightwellii.AAC.1
MNSDPTSEDGELAMSNDDNVIPDQILGTVTKRLRDEDGKWIGPWTNNPLTDTWMYENIFIQFDSEGHHQQAMKEISDHQTEDSAIPQDDSYITTHSGKHRCITTKGWSFLVEWTMGSSDWVPVKNLKESYPVQVAEYTITNK